MKMHKSVPFRKLHNLKLWSSIIRIMELHKRLSSLAQHRMMYIYIYASNQCLSNSKVITLPYAPHAPPYTHIIDKWGKQIKKIESNVFILIKLWRTWQGMQKKIHDMCRGPNASNPARGRTLPGQERPSNGRPDASQRRPGSMLCPVGLPGALSVDILALLLYWPTYAPITVRLTCTNHSAPYAPLWHILIFYFC